ncbi:MAG: response regulator [Dechloromonas sp.]|nr:response regulator [Dechloromonas sp.]
MDILVVDASPLYRDILQQNLSRHRGIQLHLATSLAEARSLANRRYFHFFVLSGQMPDGEGISLARQLRSGSATAMQPIILLTGSPSAEMAEQAVKAGVTELFRKQDVAELIAFMRHYLEVNQPLRCRVLYVEDAREQREPMLAQLLEWGMTVDAVDSADAAWPLFLAHEYDLVLCDVVLGGRMSGSRLINRIRRLPLPRGATPILAVTAFDNPARRVELFHLGIDDYVQKPIPPAELRARLYNLLSRQRAVQRSQQLLEATALGVLVFDEDGVIESGDDNVRQMLGVSAGQAWGQVRDWLPEQINGQSMFDAILLGQHMVRQPVTLRRADGSYLSALLTLLELEASRGLRQFAVLLRDVSQERAITDRLLAAKQAAERAGRMKSDFLANMSHEIRTPLNAIIGMAHLMKRAELPADQAGRLDRIDMAGKLLLNLVDDILDLSRIESGQLLLESVPVSVGSLVANVVSMLSPRAADKGLLLQQEGDAAGVPHVLLGDPTRLTQAMVNYVGNAIKFTAQGHVILRLRVDAEDGGEVLLRFEVEDSGIGIAEEDQQRIFDLFQQADNSTTRRFGGSGLGLAITRRLVNLMGGETGVISQPGLGSTFWFTARLQTTERRAFDHAQTDKLAGEAAFRARFAGTTVLLVEDDEISREVAQCLLADFGLQVDVAVDGVQAVEKALAMPYAAILMDMQMPRLDGVEATRRIRATAVGQAIPIIAMTANAFIEDREKCMAAGMNDFVAKPINPEVLIVCLQRWLSQGESS